MHIGWPDQAAAGGAALVAGAVNALAGGGTLVSFPALVALGVPAVRANVTNTVSLLPGYLAGSWAQREDLEPQLTAAKLLAGAAALGGLAGSALLVVVPGSTFRQAAPYLVLVACGLLAFGERLKRLAGPASGGGRAGAPLPVAVFAGAVYGGFFGAGLGIMFLALLALSSTQSLKSLNSLKQALSFVTNLVAAVFFVFSGRVVWTLVPVMAAGSLLGGAVGGRMARVVDGGALRRVVVAAGVAVAVSFWVF